MTDQELTAFLAWVRRRYVLARLDPWQNTAGHQMSGLIVESVSNEALVEQYRKQEHAS